MTKIIIDVQKCFYFIHTNKPKTGLLIIAFIKVLINVKKLCAVKYACLQIEQRNHLNTVL